MRITLVGVLGFVAIAALLVYVGYEWHRMTQEKQPLPLTNPIAPPVNP